MNKKLSATVSASHFSIASPPSSQEELLVRAQNLIGCTFGELARAFNYDFDKNSTYSKGSFGQLLEYILGANSKSLPEPDFKHLNIELKTLPLSKKNLPQESTYICTAPIPNPDRIWRESRVYKKMATILWVPYLESSMISERKIGTPILWHMPADIEAVLKQDWEELTEYMHLGQIEKLSAHHGTYLQIRPKAANASTFISVLNQNGDLTSMVPKGFYLRAKVTKLILQNYL